MHYTGNPVLRRSTEVNWGQMRSMTFADFLRVLLLSKVIWGADFDSYIHFALRRLEMRSWNHRVIKVNDVIWPENVFFAFWHLKIIHGNSKTIVTCSTRRKEHAGRWNFDLSSSEAKLSAITGFLHFSALDLTSEVIASPRTLNFYINLFVSRRATRSFFPRSSSSIRGETARGSYQPLPLVPWKDAKWPVAARVKPNPDNMYYEGTR